MPQKNRQKTKTKNNSNKNHEVVSGEINICKMNHEFQVFCGQELPVYRQNIAKELTE